MTARGVTPSITVIPAAEAIEFYKAAFGAVEAMEPMVTDDGMIAHAEMEVEGTLIAISDEWPGAPNRAPSTLGGTTTVLTVQTDDAETMWNRALDAGCEEVFPLQNQFYGQKSGRVRDPFGHQWMISEQIEDLTPAQLKQRADQWLAQNT